MAAPLPFWLPREIRSVDPDSPADELVRRVVHAADDDARAVIQLVTSMVGHQLDRAETEGAFMAWSGLAATICRTACETSNLQMATVHRRLVNLLFSFARYRDTANQENERPGTSPPARPKTAAEQLMTESEALENEARDMHSELETLAPTSNRSAAEFANFKRFLVYFSQRQRLDPVEPFAFWLEELATQARGAPPQA